MKVLIAGDFCPIYRVKNYLEKDHKEILGDFTQLIENADHTIINLECPITNSKNAIIKTGPALKAESKAARFLKNSKIDCVTLANNHIMDYGEEGLRDTITILKSLDIKYVGAGLEDNLITQPLILTKNEIKVGILNFCENEWSTNFDKGIGANPINPVRNYKSIKELKGKVDFVILIVHGGNEMYRLPNPKMKELYRFYIDAGADAVLSHHTHCISGYEIYNGASIFYSLGNFLFDHETIRDRDWNFGSAVTLDLSDRLSFKIHYFNQCGENPSIKLVEDDTLISKEIQTLNEIILNDSDLKSSFDDFVYKQKKMYNYYIEPHSNRYLQALQSRNIIESVWSKKKKKYLFNLIRCESHREVLLNLIKNEGIC